ncbi:MAG: hypothetical protein ACI9WU_001058 [Myxococcota bacterium]|jgi:hypothetical protein
MASVIPRILLVLALAGCEPLADETFRGEPLFAFSGQVAQFDDLPAGSAPYRVSIFWTPDGQVGEERLDTSGLHEQASVAVSLTFPLTFDIDVFEPPHTADLYAPAGQAYGIGLILAYQDRDLNGRFSEGELVGGSEQHVLIWAQAPLAAQKSPTGAALPAGVALTRLPLTCTDEAAFQLEPRDCGVPLGSACGSDADCGIGQCLTTLEGEPLPGGSCALKDTLDADPGGCLPHGGATVYDSGDYWFLGYCQSDDQCRQGQGYSCDRLASICLPFNPTDVRIVLASDFYLEPLCAL